MPKKKIASDKKGHLSEQNQIVDRLLEKYLNHQILWDRTHPIKKKWTY